MPSLRKRVANEVQGVLNNEDFGTPFDADVQTVPDYELSECESLKVTVVPVSLARTRLARNRDQVEIVINVAIQQLVLDMNGERTERLDELTEDVAAYLLGSSVTVGGNQFGCHLTDSIVVDPSTLNEKLLFSGLVSAMYRGLVDRGSA